MYKAVSSFDSVDNATLLQRLRISYGIEGSVIAWFTSYLSDRSQYVRLPASMSTESAVLYGVPQGSLLGPVLFLLYTADLLQLIRCHQLHPHAYAEIEIFVLVVLYAASFKLLGKGS